MYFRVPLLVPRPGWRGADLLKFLSRRRVIRTRSYSCGASEDSRHRPTLGSTYAESENSAREGATEESLLSDAQPHLSHRFEVARSCPDLTGSRT
jgi:hypothetical protein